MCRGATAPLGAAWWGPRTGPALPSTDWETQSRQPTHANRYRQSPTEMIEDALARAQAEAAMWRANFEKVQKMAQETNARYSNLVTQVHGGVEVKSYGLPAEAPFASQQGSVASRAFAPWQGMRSHDPWGGVLADQAQNSSNKQEQIPATPSVWNLSGGLDPDAISSKDIAAGLSDLVFPSPSAGPASSEVTSPLITPPPVVDESAGPVHPPNVAPVQLFAGLPLPPPAVSVLSRQGLKAAGRMSGLTAVAPVVGNQGTAVTGGRSWRPSNLGSPSPQRHIIGKAKPEARFGSQAYTVPRQIEASGFGENGVPLQTGASWERQMLQHPGVTTVRRTRQQTARSPRNFDRTGAVATPLQRGAGEKTETLRKEPQSPAPPTGGATRRCLSPGCTRRPSYGFLPGSKQGDKGGARWCRAHAAEGMEDLRNLKCAHVGRGGVLCRAQPSYGFEGDKRPTRCRAHAEEGMENVRMPRCRHPGGCKRQPLYGDPGAGKKPTRCRTHALPGMKDLRGAMCPGGDGTCAKRPSYGFRGDPRPTRCGAHKEPGMEDLISARCDFPDCRTVASYGLQAPDTHVIRRTRCKAHRTPEMTCGTRGPACTQLGGCETRPSYGWGDKFDGEHPPRPERCKKHSLPGMEYMGSAARAKKRKMTEVAKEEPPPTVLRSAVPRPVPPPVEPTYFSPPPRVRPSRKCATKAPIIELEDEDDLFDEPPENLAQGWSPESCTRAGSGEECARGWSPESRMVEDPEEERARLVKSARFAEEERTRALRDLENLGDFRALQELKEIEDQANDEIWGDGPDSPELAGLSAFDKEFSSDWARPESPDSGGVRDVNIFDTASSWAK